MAASKFITALGKSENQHGPSPRLNASAHGTSMAERMTKSRSSLVDIQSR
jgi:hypothetical protein